MPRVSVLMPVWNAGPFLAPALASVLAQRGVDDWELLVADDGSTDGSGETLTRLAATDRRVRLIHRGTLNHGIAAARNRLLDAAQRSGSPFVAFLNADDLAHPGRLCQQLAYLDANPRVAMLGSGHGFIDGDGRALPGSSTMPARDLEIRWTGLLDCPMRVSTLTVRAALLSRLDPPGFDPAWVVFSDYDFVMRAVAAAWTMNAEAASLTASLASYRRHPGAISVRRRDLLVTNGARIAAAAIARELPGFAMNPEAAGLLRAALLGMRPTGWRPSLSGHRQAVEIYLDLFDAFRQKHHDHPDLAQLRAGAVVEKG